MNQLDRYIKKEERRLGRPIRSYTKTILRDFLKFLQTDTPELEVSPSVIATGPKIALIIQNVGHMTGGRYYAWFVAMALMEIGYDVTVYTNLTPAFYSNFKEYKQPKVVVIGGDPQDLETMDIKADIYIGAPIYGSMGAIALGKKYNKPSYAFVFDPWPLMEKYLDKEEHNGWYANWEELIPALQNSNTKIISLCQTTTPYIYDWLNKKEEDVFPIIPCVNSKEQAKAPAMKRENYVVFVSRLAKHKNIEHVLQAVKDNDVQLKIISSTQSQTTVELIRKMGLKNQVQFYIQIGDREKFRLISGAQAVISASTFEGWGLWASEAIACGTPLVCYDYPTIHEQQEISGADNIYFARHNMPENLSRALGIALKEARVREANPIFDFDHMVARVRELFGIKPKIGIVMICLNEEKFIGAALKSVIKHPNVVRVAVVEGAVKLYSPVSDRGLSVDKTQDAICEVMRGDRGEKITYEPYGWAVDKSELRNRALSLLPEDVTHVLVVDGDEIWAEDDLDRLAAAMEEHPDIGVFRFPFYHFWKKRHLVAVGSQWESMMFRCFKYADKSLHWDKHNLPVVNAEGRSIDETAPKLTLEDVHVYHCGYLKGDRRVVEKLDYYQKRDPHLNVDKSIYLFWKEGKPTQPTHGGGDVQAFGGEYPEQMQKLIERGII